MSAGLGPHLLVYDFVTHLLGHVRGQHKGYDIGVGHRGGPCKAKLPCTCGVRSAQCTSSKALCVLEAEHDLLSYHIMICS